MKQADRMVVFSGPFSRIGGEFCRRSIFLVATHRDPDITMHTKVFIAQAFLSISKSGLTRQRLGSSGLGGHPIDSFSRFFLWSPAPCPKSAYSPIPDAAAPHGSACSIRELRLPDASGGR